MTIIPPTFEPAEITAGLSTQWTIDLEDYKPADGYTLNYYLLKDSKQIVLNSYDNGDGKFLFQITSAVSATYEVGNYNYKLVALLSGEKYEIKSGVFKINPDYINLSGGYDTRTHNQITLDNIQKTIRGLANKSERQYSINGKSLERFSIAELIKVESQYKKYVQDDIDAEKLKAGLGSGRKVRVRFI